MAEPKIQLAPLPYGFSQGAGLNTSRDYTDRTQAFVTANMPQAEPPVSRERVAAAAYSPSKKQFFVSGPQGSFTFDDGNDTAAVESLKVFDPSKPMALPPGDWQPLTPDGYAAYVENIRNPGMGRLAKKNFGIGIDNLQALAGAGLKFAGAEETGQRIIDQQEADLAKTSVYQRQASDIGSDPSRGILDWFVANLAQQGPNIVESAVTAVIGAAAGAAAGGGPNPVTAIGGAFASLVGKSAFKTGLLAAAKKHAAGELLEAGERKLLMEAAGITAAADDVAIQLGLKAGADAAFKQAGRFGGAGLATLGSNEAMGIADIYSEPGATRATALIGSVPYTLLESSTEFLLAGRLLGDIASGGKPLRDLGYSRKAMELLRRTSVGGAAGGAAEGAVEAGQEALLLAANPGVDWNSPEGMTRLFNAFAAGAGVGGPIGSMANLKGRTDPVNLLKPTQDTSPTPAPMLALPAPAGPQVAAESAFAGVGGGAPSLGNQIPEGLGTGSEYGAVAAPDAGAARLAAAPTATVTAATETTLGGPSAVLRRRQPPAPMETSVQLEPVTAPRPELDLSTGYSGQVAAPPAPAMPQYAPPPAVVSEPPVQELNAELYPQAPAEPALSAPVYVPSAAALKKGVKSPVKVLKASSSALLERNYNAVADALIQKPGLVPGQLELAERLATMSDVNLKKLAPVWDAKFEPDVTTDPAKVHALIDRTIGGKPWAQNAGAKLKKGAKKEIVTKPVAEKAVPVAAAASTTKGAALKKAAKPSTAPAIAPTPAAKTTPGAAALALKKETPPPAMPRIADTIKKKKPPPGSMVKNAAGVAAPSNKAAAVTILSSRRKIGDDGAVQEVQLSNGKTVVMRREPPGSSYITGWYRDDVVGTPTEVMTKGYLGDNRAEAEAKLLEQEGVSVKPDTTGELNEAIETWNDSKDTDERTSAAQYVVSTAFFGDSNDKTFGRTQRALATLDSMLLDAMRDGGDAGVALDNAIVAEALANTDAPKRKEFQELVSKRRLRDRIEVKVKPESVVLDSASKAGRLTAVIDEMLTSRDEMQNPVYRAMKSNEAKRLYDAMKVQGLDPVIHGVKASELFKVGRLDMQEDTETGLFRLSVGVDLARDVMVASDAPTGMFSRVDGTPLTKKFAPAEVRMKMDAILSRFRFKPKTAVYRNVADFKAKNPGLYKRAAAAREQGDFDTTNAAGYSFADHVIVFSDFIRDERHLALTVSHETLGHFGLRAIMPQATLSATLDSIYASDSRLQQIVDQIVEDTGMNRNEVIEEYLADYAAVIDNSLLRNIWNAIKNALNKLGVSFDDDHARLVLNQVRRYMRNSYTGGSFFSATSMYDAMERMAAEHGTGRFAADPLDDEAHLSSKMIAAQGISSLAGKMNGVLGWGPWLKKYGASRTFGAASDSQKDLIRKIVGVVTTLDFKASRSEGLGDVYRLFESQHNLSRQLLTQFQQLTSFTHKPNWWVAHKDAPVETDKLEASELLGYAALAKLGAVDTTMMDSYGELFTVDEYGNTTENETAIKKMMKDGFVTADEFRKGLKWTDSLGNENTYKAREIDENSKYWKIYVEQRNAVNAAAVAVLRANHKALSLQNMSRFDAITEMSGSGGAKFTADDLTTLQEVSRQFYKMYLEGHETKKGRVELDQGNVAKAKEFIAAVTRLFDPEHGEQKLKDWLDGADNTSDFQGPEFKKVIAGLNGLSKLRLREKDNNRVRQILQNSVVSQVEALNAEYYAKRTILSSYAPLKRDGKFQIRLRAIGKNGKPVVLGTDFQGVLPYYREDSEKAAIDIMEELNKLYGSREYEVRDDLGDPMKVRFVAEYSTAKQTPDLGDVMDYANFVYILERQNISITPAERERLVTGLTAQGSMSRGNLERTGNPGWRPNMIRNISEHLETQAHVAAKRTFRNEMDAVIDNDSKWRGDRDKLERLQQAYKAKGLTPTQRDYLKREYDDYASKYANMASVSDEHSSVDIEVNGKTRKLALRGKGEEYREEAKRLLRWQAETLDITDSTEDWLSTGIGAQLKTVTVLAQLGMSVATAFVNVGSLVTHSTTYMSFYNERNGFGMGFGMAKSSMAIARATGELKNNSFTDPKWLAKMIEDGKLAEYGLEKHEAEMLLEQTTNGTLQPAQFNALIGSARGKTQGNRINDAIQKWMYMFSYTESLNRRVTILAAYRLELARIKASTSVSDEAAHKLAATAAHKAVITSQGEYSMFNRPELARGNLGQYIFMYKMFTAITVQMMRNLPPKGRVTFLVMMLVASGVKGVPFAEDIMDLIDTLAQMFGIKMTSIEKEAYQLFDGLAPGYAPYFMRGAIDQLTGSTVSSKVGMGDIVPLSGALKYGSDPWNETKQFVGPVFGAVLGLAGMAQLIGKYGAESVGIKSDATTFNDILRKSPLAVMRSIGDSTAYMESGAITNIRGQVVSRDVGYSTMVARLMGFYPAETTRQNDIIRLSKMGGEYAKAIKAELVNAYVQAGIRGDKDQMKHISKQVMEWNIDARGTGLEVKDFQNAVKKSLTEAKREAVARFRRSTSKQMQPHVDELMRLQGVDPAN